MGFTVSTALWALFGGTLIGVLVPALLTPRGGVERGDVPLWLTALVGILGVCAGGIGYGLVFGIDRPGVDWWRHGWQIGVAVAAVSLVALATARRRRS